MSTGQKSLPGSLGSTPQQSITTTPTPYADNSRKTTLQCLPPCNTTTPNLLWFLLPQPPQSLKEHPVSTSITLSYNLPPSLGTSQCRHLRQGQKHFRPQTLHPLLSLKAGMFHPQGPCPRSPAEPPVYQQVYPATSHLFHLHHHIINNSSNNDTLLLPSLRHPQQCSLCRTQDHGPKQPLLRPNPPQPQSMHALH